MSSHNNRSRHNPNTSTANIVHDKDRAGVPENIPMLEHIGDSSPVDKDVGYTELQRDIIDKSEKKLYNRRQHDIRFDLPEDGYDPVKTAHPLGVSAVHSHGDKGFDYRDFPDNVAQDHEKFDPYTQYLHSKGLIGLNKTRYITNYVNIDSRDRNKFPCTKNESPIQLNMDPLSFNADILRIDISDVEPEIVERMTPGTKIVIRGLEECQFTLRSSVPNNFGNLVDSFVFEDGKQYMRIEANNNMDIQTGTIADVKEDYDDIKVRFEGFIGDVQKRYLFDLTGFTVTTSPDAGDPTNTVFSIEENVYGDIPFKVADFVVDRFGTVIEDNTLRPYPDVITWMSASVPPSATNPISLTPAYFGFAASELNDNLPPPTIPVSFVDYMRYIEAMQNIVRPILFGAVGTGDGFVHSYIDNNDTYETGVRFVLEDQTVCTQTSRYGNIPLNFLNMSHRIFFTASDVEACLAGEPLTEDIPSSSNFFIKLDRPYQKSEFVFNQPMGSSILQVIVFETSLSDVLVAFKHYGGVPNRSINAEYPLGPLADAGFRLIRDVIRVNGRTFALVQLSKAGFLNRNFGGDCLTIALVDSEESGSIQPNRYIVEFGRVYYKVVLIKMVSSQFPITQKAFTDGITGGVRNNRFYWQNLNDGSIIYQIEVEPGDYTSAELEAELEKKVREVPRFDEEIPRNIPNVMKFDIDPNTDLVKISSFNFCRSPCEPFVLAHNFVDINTAGSPENLDPENQYYVFPGQYYTDFPDFSTSCQCFRIKIFYPNHGLNRFDEILIEGSINFGVISADDLNGPHIVTQVIDENNYDIVLKNINEIQLQAYTAMGTVDPITGTITANTMGTIQATTSGTIVTDASGNIDIDATGDVDIDASGNIASNTIGTIDTSASGTVNSTTTGTIDVDASGNLDLTIDGTIDADISGNITDPSNNLVSNIDADITGDIDADITGDIDVDISGNVSATTSGTVNADISGNIVANTTGMVDIDASGNIDIDGTGDIDIDATGRISADLMGTINADTTGNFNGNAEFNATIDPVIPSAKGGYQVVFLTPNRFRLRFDEPDTIGTQLGFRAVGVCTSITPYDTMITNDVLYEDESITDVLTLINPDIDVSAVDTSDLAIRNSVVLVGPPYLLITAPEVENVRGRGRVKDIFYKINLRDNSRNSGADDRVEPMAYDTYADTPIFYNEPLRRLEKLTLEFLTPDGELYDFNGVDHSFVLEIVTYEEVPEATSLQKH